MATPENKPETWASLLNPDDVTLDRLRRAGQNAASFVAVGSAWDTVGVGWEALVIAPLERGLGALDVFGLPLAGNYPVIADHARSELIVLVPGGTAARAAESGTQGVRVLTADSYLMVPCGPWGSYVAAWLSRPNPGWARYVDPLRLCEAVRDAEARRGEHAPAL